MNARALVAVVVVFSGCPGGPGLDGGTDGGSNFGGGGATGGGATGGGATGGGSATGGGATGGGVTGGGSATGGGATGGGGAPTASAFFQQDVGTEYPVVIAGADGTFHVAYATGFGQTLRYGRCSSNCGAPSGWTFVTLFTLSVSGGVDDARMVVGTDGRAHIIYERDDGTGPYTWYATCGSNCTQPASWTHLELTTLLSGTRSVFRGSPMVIDAAGRISFVTSDTSSNGRIMLTTCASACDQLANWQSGLIRQGGMRMAMAAQGTTLHAIVNDEASRLHYRSCASNCTQLSSWTESGNLFVHDGTMPTAIAVGANGKISIAYNQGFTSTLESMAVQMQANKLLVWQCDTNCGVDTSWTGVILGAVRDGEEGIGLVEIGGALVLSLTNSVNWVAGVCTANCVTATSWSFGELDTIDTMASALDPYQAYTCSGGSRPTFAAWYPNDGLVAVSPTTGAAVFVNAPYVLRSCGGANARQPALLRVSYSP